MEVSLGQELITDLRRFEQLLRRWSKEGRARYKIAHRRIGQKWRAEAVKRVPVDEGTLKQRIVTNTSASGDDIETECGSNVPYSVFLEFGTEYIAGGLVKQRFGEPAGYPVDVRDAEAVHDWPAKSGEAVEGTSSMLTTDRRGTQRLRNAGGRFVAGSSQEQLPFLRPAFGSIREWAIKELAAAYEPPK